MSQRTSGRNRSCAMLSHETARGRWHLVNTRVTGASTRVASPILTQEHATHKMGT